jgi:tetratricopeptide (TPR) repeat protein
LVAKSLVRRSTADDGWSRYRMLETVREFGAEELTGSGEEEAVRARHAHYFVDRCHRMWINYEDLADPTAWRHYRAPEEDDNLRAALDWCRQHDPEAGLVLVGSLIWPPYRYQESLRRITELLELAPTAPLATRAGAFVALGAVSQDNDKAESALYHGEALKLYVAAGDDSGAALAQSYLAYQCWRSGQIEAFRANNERSRVLAESSGNTRALISYHDLSAEAACDSGDFDSFVAHLEAIRRIHLAAGFEPLPEVWPASRRMMGAALYFAGRPQEAREVLDRVVAESRTCDSVDSGIWNYAGRTYLALGQVDVAATFFREGLDTALANEIRDLMIWNLEGLASVAHRRGQAHRAALLFGAASTMRADFNCALEPAEAPRRERELAEIREALGHAGAEAALGEGRALGRDEAVALALSDAGQLPSGA